MSIKVTKAEGVTVVTVAANSKSTWPPICQILGALCYNPICCSVSQGMKRLQGTSQQVLGTIQIMVGLLNIGLGAIVLAPSGGRQLVYMGVPYWLGGVFIAVGISCILVGRFPSPCLMFITVFMNCAGAALAITGIVFYAIDLGGTLFGWVCQMSQYNDDNDYSYRRRYQYRYRYDDYEPFTTIPTTPSEEKMRRERLRQEYMTSCGDARSIAVMLTKSLDIVLIVLAVLQLCVTISSCVMGMKALKNRRKEEESCSDVECYKPLLEGVSIANPVV